MPPGDTPPDTPSSCEGEWELYSERDYTYTTQVTHPEVDQVWVMWDWGTAVENDWVGPYPTGEAIAGTQRWAESGTYAVRVKARDAAGQESGWSEPLEVIVAVWGDANSDDKSRNKNP